MGERVLPTVQVLSEVAKTRVEREGKLTVRPLETRTPKPKIMIREMEGGEGAAPWKCRCRGW